MNKRVHGNYFLVRRKNPEAKKYNQYLEFLREDFKCICGYCGKPEELSTKGFEIDHFVPRTLDKERENDYTNLVYSCFTCNRKKKDKWPTNRIDLDNDGKIGFIDPTTIQYDEAVYRDDDGSIKAINEVGQYMVDIGFKFSERPISEVYRATKLILYKRELSKLLDENPSLKDYKKYKTMDLELQKLCSFLFQKKE